MNIPKFSALLVVLLMGLLIIPACKPDAASTDPANDEANTPVEAAASVPQPAEGFDPVASPVPPPLDMPLANTLLKSPYWVAEFWVQDGQSNPDQKCRWWKFEADGTYTTGVWQEVLAEGVWAMTDDQGKTLIHLDANVKGLNEEFEIQGVSPAAGYMSWVGTRLYGMNMVAVKAISLLTMPTKAQFGVAE
ncbi:MAG: hypothetical protein KDC54_09140 [Lewinella sp.]|nr:hypothetical protein [Lewinella sp.]